MTLKGKSLETKIFGAYYLKNGWRYRLDYNGTSVGNGRCADVESNGHMTDDVGEVLIATSPRYVWVPSSLSRKKVTALDRLRVRTNIILFLTDASKICSS